MEQDGTPEHGEPEKAVGDCEHLAGIADGCGCTEIWEHLSERRTTEG